MSYITVNKQFATHSSGVDPLVSEIVSFLSLPMGWCNGYGRPAYVQSAVNALSVLRFMRDLGYDREEAFPDPNGSVLLSAFSGASSVEVLCQRDGTYEYMLEAPGADPEIYEDIDQRDISKRLWDVSCQNLKNSLGFYIPGSSASTKEDLKAQHLRISTTDCLSLIPVAPSQQVATYADISQGTTQVFLGIPQYTGEYQSASSLITRSSIELNQTQAMTAITSQWVSPTNITETGSYQSV